MQLGRCANCGATLTPDDLEHPGCVYCGAALPHQVAAARKGALVRELLADRDGDGVPDVFQAMTAASAITPATNSSVVNVPGAVVARSSVSVVNLSGGGTARPVLMQATAPIATDRPRPRNTARAPSKVFHTLGVLFSWLGAVLLAGTVAVLVLAARAGALHGDLPFGLGLTGSIIGITLLGVGLPFYRIGRQSHPRTPAGD